MAKKINNTIPTCSKSGVEGLAAISPNKKLIPIDGKFYWNVDESVLPTSIDKFKVIFSFERAFNEWSQYIAPIKFEPTGDISKAQIVLRFRKNGDVDLPFPFGSTVLAYAFAPDGKSLGVHADIYFDLRWKWDDMLRENSILLYKVSVHEIFHTLNGGHSKDANDIMAPIYRPNNEVNVTKDTQQFIYNTYKEYGVKNPNAGNEVNPNPKTLSLKQLFSSKSDVGRLSLAQLSILNSFLSAGILSKDRFDIRVKKIYNAIHRA